jgi:putative photosynthetic complex assembly protein 2
MAGATLLLGIALCGLATSSVETTPAAAYEAFACGLVVWAWQLVSYYMGYITGPRETACEADCVGWKRFVEAVRTSLYHELTIIVFAIGLLALTRGQPNQIGVWTFCVLWWMHTSAKLNVYFGVPNLSEELLPQHLHYLVSFMARKPMNLFFPLSVSVSTVVTVLLAQSAMDAPTFEATGYTILATLMVLAVAEHWFLVAPLHANVLWQWGAKDAASKDSASEEAAVETRLQAREFASTL